MFEEFKATNIKEYPKSVKIDVNGLEVEIDCTLLEYAKRARIEDAVVAKIQYKEAQ